MILLDTHVLLWLAEDSPRLGFHGDPADRMIVASARLADAILLTADAAILRWSGDLKTHDARR